MIVGNGLVASAFAAFAEDDDYVIFASGVSNSQEKDPAAYQREFDLLRSHLRPDTCLVYFSTCSIADQSRSHSHYIQHKIKVEEYIANHASDYVIFRHLPNRACFKLAGMMRAVTPAKMKTTKKL